MRMTELPGSWHIPFPTPNAFERLDPETRSSLESELVWFSVMGGQFIYRANDQANGIFMVLTGCLGIFVDTVSAEEPALLVQAGEIVGEYAVLLGRRQVVSCMAIRDTSLAWLPNEAFERLVRKHPASLFKLTAELVDAMSRVMTFRHRSFTTPSTLALIPLHEGIRIDRFSPTLVAAISKMGCKAVLVDRSRAASLLDARQTLESKFDLVVYAGDPADWAWSETCIRQADRVLLLASDGQSSIDDAGLLNEVKKLPWRRAELVVVQPDRAPAPSGPWLKRFPVPFACRVRPENDADIMRLARYVTGKAIAVVLSGGGARGFAHIGAIRALRHAHIPIDIVGGTSIGAVIAAGVALEWDDKEMYERVYDGFVRSNPLNDYTIPVVALVKGRNVERRLRKHFSEFRAEDLWLPYFAVASNLTSGKLAVLRQGDLWRILRASIAVPGLLPPVTTTSEILVDGGLMDNLPCDVMDRIRHGPVVGIDVTRYGTLPASDRSKQNLFRRLLMPADYSGPSIVSLLLRAATVSSDIQTMTSRDHADLVLAPPLDGIEVRDWHAIDRAIEHGYRFTMERIEDLEKFVTSGASERAAA
jgi:NTE family protein